MGAYPPLGRDLSDLYHLLRMRVTNLYKGQYNTIVTVAHSNNRMDEQHQIQASTAISYADIHS